MKGEAMFGRETGPPAATPSEWSQWQRDVFGDPYLVWHDGADFTALLQAARADPVGVARLLFGGLSAGDPLAAESIAVLTRAGLTPEGSERLLRHAVATASGTFVVRLAEALLVLTADQAWASPIASVLATGRHWGERIDAAIALGAFDPNPQLVRALTAAVCDHEYLVRYHAARTLLGYAREGLKLTDFPDISAKISSPATGRPSAVDRAGWQDAAAVLSRIALRPPPAPGER